MLKASIDSIAILHNMISYNIYIVIGRVLKKSRPTQQSSFLINILLPERFSPDILPPRSHLWPDASHYLTGFCSLYGVSTALGRADEFRTNCKEQTSRPNQAGHRVLCRRSSVKRTMLHCKTGQMFVKMQTQRGSQAEEVNQDNTRPHSWRRQEVKRQI